MAESDIDDTPVPNRDILDLVERFPGALRQRQILSRLGIAEARYRDLCHQIDLLETKGLLVKGRGGRYRLPGEGSILGHLDVKSGGFAFVISVRPGQPDVFVPPNVIGSAMDGDLVLAEQNSQRSRRARGPVAKKLIVVERAHSRIVGLYIASGHDGTVLPDRRTLRDIVVTPGNRPRLLTAKRYPSKSSSTPPALCPPAAK